MSKEIKEQISAQLKYSKWINEKENDAGQQIYGVREKSIYEFTGNHWRALDPSQIESEACEWLSKFAPDKCNEKTAASCVNTAILRLRAIPETKKNIIPLKSESIEFQDDGKLLIRPSCQEDGMTYSLACDYNLDCKPEKFLQFLVEALPQQEVREFLQEYVGYTLLGDTRYQVAAWLLGEGGTGKGTVAQIVQALHRQTIALSLDALDGFKLAGLHAASLVCVDETPQRINEQTLKTLISGDTIQIDRKYRDPLTIRPTAKWLVNGNALPAISDHSTGFWRRWLIFPFDVVPAKKTPMLAKTIIDTELSGVLNWALEGLGRLLKRDGFPDQPAAMRNAAANGKMQSNSVAAWVQDAGIKCDETKDKEENKEIVWVQELGANKFAEPEKIVNPFPEGSIKNTRRDVYAAYSNWCGESGTRAVAANKFWERLRQILPDMIEERTQEGGERSRKVNIPLPKQ